MSTTAPLTDVPVALDSVQPRFYNTLTNSMETFSPLQPGRVKMYNCGPTVYDYAHVGNFRTFLFADVLRRTLELIGYDVHQVMNLTDVGHMTDDSAADGGGQDKMQVAAERLAQAKKSGQAHLSTITDPHDPYQVAQFYIEAFLEDARQLGLKVASEYPHNMPKATEHVPQMLAMIGRLLDKGHAYVAEGGAVYFDVQSYPDYGQLSNNTLDRLKGGAGGRVEGSNQSAKKHPADFLLWKHDAAHLMKWDPAVVELAGQTLQGPVAQLGEGYPGWHIECSAMATHVLNSPVIDIHTGGEDNIFPHHECEIAQTRCSTGESLFAQFWMHSRHLFVEGQKMSKSKGNFFTARQVLNGDFTGKPVDPAVLRYELIRVNYRGSMDFTKKGLQDSASAVMKLRRAAHDLSQTEPSAEVSARHPVMAGFTKAMAEDLNIAAAIAELFGLLGDTRWTDAEKRAALELADTVLGVGLAAEAQSPEGKAHEDAGGTDPQALAKALDDARAAKDYAKADTIRAELTEAGYEVKTTKDGTVAMKKLG